MTGSILSKVVINDNLKKIAKELIDSICHMYLSDKTHKWIESFRGEIPKIYFSLFVKDIINYFNPYIIDCEKKHVPTNTHSHRLVCESGKRRGYICQLSIPRIINEKETRPLLIILKERLNVEKNKKLNLIN